MIMAHEVGLDMTSGEIYARALAGAGIASYLFDFRGGYPGERHLPFCEMSIQTEREDLNGIIDAFSEDERFDQDSLFLLGRSQGGLVAAMSAAEREEKVAGLALFYPAFVMKDYFMKEFGSRNTLPERFPLLGMQVGEAYLKAALEVDVETVQRSYRGDVIIFHGSEDHLVPLSYSEKALACYKNARLVTVDGACHVFTPEQAQRILPLLISFFHHLLEEKDKTRVLSN